MIKTALFISCVILALTSSVNAQEDPIEKCNLGHAKSCFDLGFLRMTGYMGVKVDMQSAEDFFIKGCKLKGAQSCSALGFIYQKGKNGTKDDNKAREFYKQGCDLGDPQGCMALGRLYLENTKKDVSAKDLAFKAFNQACTLDYAPSCVEAALLNEDKALALYQKGCELKNGKACNLQGELLAQSDTAKALSLYQKSCDLKYGDGCRNLGLTKEGDEQMTLLKHACDLNDLVACNLQGEALLKNKDENSLTKARELFKKACGIHSAKACVNLATMYEQGIFISKNLEEALDNYMRGCVYGDKNGCKNAERLAPKVENLKKIGK